VVNIEQMLLLIVNLQVVFVVEVSVCQGTQSTEKIIDNLVHTR